MEDPVEAVMRKSRELLAQASQLRKDLEALPANDPAQQKLEETIRFLVQQSRDLAGTAKSMLSKKR